ncbi:MAG: NAD(+) kinase [Chromatiales bacterium]|nr:NAD(+) kinase [Chromatiales bacterium]
MASRFQSIGLIGKPEDPRVSGALAALAGWLGTRVPKVLFEETTAACCAQAGTTGLPIDELARRVDLAIVLGGDGTLLHCARAMLATDVPLVGVNLGRLGFLAEISAGDMQTSLERILDGEFLEERRSILACEIEHEGHAVSRADAFNDVVVHKWGTARMIELETTIGGRFLNRQRADGLIVSTPTGSTAYALSGGGPILEPQLDATLLVPICPHTLSNRPLVVSGDEPIEITVADAMANTARVTCDGQTGFEVPTGARVRVVRKRERVRLLHLPEYDYFSVLRAKLRWG